MSDPPAVDDEPGPGPVVLVCGGQGAARVVPSRVPGLADLLRASTALADFADADEIDLARLRPDEAQPLLVAYQVANGRLARARHDVVAVAGSSLGELSAAVLGGMVELEDALTLAALRARLPQELLADGSWAMAAVAGPDERELGALVEGVEAEVAVANSPVDHVVSGRRAAVERLAAAVGRNRARALPVLAPYHTRWMTPIVPAYREALRAVTFCAGDIDVMSATTRAATRSGTAERATLLEAVRRPARWATTLRHVAASRASVVDCGPSSGLARLVHKNHLSIRWHVQGR